MAIGKIRIAALLVMVFLINWVTRSMFLHNAGYAGPEHQLLK